MWGLWQTTCKKRLLLITRLHETTLYSGNIHFPLPSAAHLNLEFAIEAAGKVDKTPDPRWLSVVDKIKIPFDEQLR